MSQIEALDDSALMVGLPDDLSADVEGRHRQQPDIELQRHSEVAPHFFFELVLVVSEPAEIFSVVPHRLPEILGVVQPLAAKAESTEGYLPRVMI